MRFTSSFLITGPKASLSESTVKQPRPTVSLHHARPMTPPGPYETVFDFDLAMIRSFFLGERALARHSIRHQPRSPHAT